MLQRTSSRCDGQIHLELIHPRLCISQNSKSKRRVGHTPIFSVSVKNIHSNDNTCSTTGTPFQQMRTNLREEISTPYKIEYQPERPVSFRDKPNELVDNVTYKHLQIENRRKRYNQLFHYVLKILYSILGIFFLAALIVPSILIYLLAPTSSRTEMTQLPTYTNHCSGISPSTRWQVNNTITITMTINTTQCNFPKSPMYFVSIVGGGSHYCLVGYGAIYLPTKESFQIYTRYACSIYNSTLLLSLALNRSYDVYWTGFYK